MKPALRKVPITAGSSFSFRIDRGEALLNTWHFHPEIELLHLKNSEGTRIIGNSVHYFGNDEVLLIGSNLPHAFIHHPQNLQNATVPAEAFVIHFMQSFLGDFLALPEVADIEKVLKSSRRGLIVKPKFKKQVISLIDKMAGASSMERLLLLLNILKVFTAKNSSSPLVRQGFIYSSSKTEDEDRINKIYAFTAENYDQAIRIEEVAGLINLTKKSVLPDSLKQKQVKPFLSFNRVQNWQCLQAVA